MHTEKNLHKYIDKDGNHAIKGGLTGWLFTDSVRQCTCPHCGSEPGYLCQTPHGGKVWPPHTKRVAELQKV